MNEDLKNSVLKSNTSLLGLVCKDGIIMAADRQTTAGNIVVNKTKTKIDWINENIIASWTGMVSDAQMTKKLVAAELKLKELRSKQKVTVKEAANLLANISYKNIRQFSAVQGIVGSLVAGVNEDGSFELYTIEPAGSVSRVEDYDANFSSGMPYILGLLEKEYNENISVKEGIELAINAIKSSSQRDIGSGYGIDVFTVTKDGIKHEVKQKVHFELKNN